MSFKAETPKGASRRYAPSDEGRQQLNPMKTDKMKTLRKITVDEVQWTVTPLPEDQSPEDAHDCSEGEHLKECQRIRTEAVWNEWAWCCVEVKGYWNGLQGIAYLGACSYRNEDDFKQDGGYFKQLQSEAMDDLQSRAERIAEALN